MSVHLDALVLDALDPVALASFWATALRWEVSEAGPDRAVVSPTDGTTFHLSIERVAHPKLGQNRIHLDLTTSSLADQVDSVATLLALGARRIDIGQDPDDDHEVLADPEGNEFCIIGPTNRFLAGCGRLGAVNCDGTRELGVFWSEAFGLPLVWDQDEETAIRVPGTSESMITWSGPPLMPRQGPDRHRFRVRPAAGSSAEAEMERLLALGASRPSADQGRPGAVLIDPDGNEFTLVG
ncbi:MAG: hypothetical protein KDB40_19280 [Acidimicrobiales bacterium]|nr:hypothetical protein [Acidimicrobiales bacterium]MCB9396155.1 VOC family protein [Acidimicrobiaceae bacterium]